MAEQRCPTCGHAVRVVGDTTQHYEPTGCAEPERVAAVLRWLTDSGDITPMGVRMVRQALYPDSR